MNATVGTKYYFHNHWHFLLADAFPLKNALELWKDENGCCFYEPDYHEAGWKEVTLPHTFNDLDLFVTPIQDAGSGQKRTFGFYRSWLTIPPERDGQKVLLEFEGMRQTCYLYVNGTLAGYHENGVSPFGFDISHLVDFQKPNLIAIATDNTSTRNIACCIAETPNKPDVAPGSYLFAQDAPVDEACQGVGFFWNCNDFNPSLGGITRPVLVHFKPQVYLTLPLYSNLQTKGVYVYGTDYDTLRQRAKVAVEAEIRNEGDSAVASHLEVTVMTLSGEEIAVFRSAEYTAPPSGCLRSPLSIVPEDAYEAQMLPDGRKHYIPVEKEAAVSETATDSVCVTTLSAVSEDIPLRFWSIADPYLYRVRVCLFVNGVLTDQTVIETGFRKTGYDKDKGVLLNDVPVWLRGYAQRSANEWAAIGIAPEWLKDMDAMLIRESNANHIRWMHVAASPADIRSMDRHGIVCTQPAGDKERENFGRQWDQRVELMRDIIIAFRNSPSIVFWETGNNSVSAEHMREMRLLKEKLDPHGGRFMGCRTLNTAEVVNESEYVGTMLNRHAARFLAEHGPITETEYSREEAPRRIWDDFTPPDFDYRNKWLGKGGRKQVGMDFYDLTSEDLAKTVAAGYSEFFHDRIGGASQKDLYSACAALCWTDSAQHGRQSYSENARMSGRVDPVRIKKQNFDIFRVMQSPTPQVKIFGHWNYPPEDGVNYRYHNKKFNGSYWEETEELLYRDPKRKTVYVFASYDIARVELRINGRVVGSCEKPVDTFVFPIENVDVTEHGSITAYGFDYDGKPVAQDELHTVGKPHHLLLTPHTSPMGFLADQNDIACIDVAVVDQNGDICPLCFERIAFQINGEGEFLGGYNSGRYNGYGKADSVIHTDHIYAECGTNRVFVRSTQTAGTIILKASMQGLAAAEITLESHETSQSTLTAFAPNAWYADYSASAVPQIEEFKPIPAADAVKYVKEDKLYCKILVNGQEPDQRGVRCVNEKGFIWGNILCILERLHGLEHVSFEYQYLEEEKKLLLKSGNYRIEAIAGHTHLLVNGKENLMDGQPYVTSANIFVMEVSAIVSYISGVTAYYDDKVNVFRIETA